MGRNKFILTAIIKNRKGNIISIGKNNYTKTHPEMYRIAKSIGQHYSKRVFIHAEIDAIVKCENLKEAYSIEVYRVGKNGIYLCSRPCIICTTGISRTNISKIIYCNEEGLLQISTAKDLINFWKEKRRIEIKKLEDNS